MCAQSSSKGDREAILDVFEAPDSDAERVYSFETAELTALCPFDFGGPDYYDFTLRYVPSEECVESKSLKHFLESFRDQEITAEEMGAEMYEAFDRLMHPEAMYLRLEQARRGGIEETVEYGDRSLRSD
jgi:7-cyano-7-deazaguanine reductase